MIELQTERLVLRPLRPEDWPGARAFLTCTTTMRYLGGVQYEADAWRTFASWLGMWQLTPAAMFAVIEKASGEWIGRIGPWHPLRWPVREVGWGLRREWTGRGLAYEAAKASVAYAHETLGWDTVSHLIDDANHSSQRLAERLGAEPGETVRLPGSLSGTRVRVWRQGRVRS